MNSSPSAQNTNDIHSILNALQAPIPTLSALLPLLAAPLAALHILPPRFHRFLPPGSKDAGADIDVNVNVPKHIPRLQSILLSHIVPVWLDALRSHSNPQAGEESLDDLLYQFFSPSLLASASQPRVTNEIAIQAYLTLSSSKYDAFVVEVLRRLQTSYPLDGVHAALFSTSTPRSVPSSGYGSKDDSSKKKRSLVIWEDVVRCILSIPTKVANYYGPTSSPPPPSLSPSTYFTHLSKRLDILLSNQTQRDLDDEGAFSPFHFLSLFFPFSFPFLSYSTDIGIWTLRC